jgi:hypothetical protein
MGFNKCYLPPVDVMKSELNKFGLNIFVESHKKYDCVIGETDRMNFFNELVKEYENKLKTSNENIDI